MGKNHLVSTLLLQSLRYLPNKQQWKEMKKKKLHLQERRESLANTLLFTHTCTHNTGKHRHIYTHCPQTLKNLDLGERYLVFEWIISLFLSAFHQTWRTLNNVFSQRLFFINHEYIFIFKGPGVYPHTHSRDKTMMDKNRRFSWKHFLF